MLRPNKNVPHPHPHPRLRLRLRLRPILGLALLAHTGLLTGCAVGPDFHSPAANQGPNGYAIPAPDTGASPTPSAALGEGPDARWWHAFGAPELDALVARALADNPGLAASRATLARANARVAAVAGARLPQLDANARAEHELINLAAFGFNPASFPGGLTNPEIDLYSVGGGVSFDPDLWGRNARALEQARADGEAQYHQTEAAHLTLTGRVVTTYLMIAAIRDTIATQSALIEESRRNLALTRARKEAGSGTMVEVLSAQAQLSADEGALPALRQDLAEARDLLATLLGITPADLGATDYSLGHLTMPTSIPVALPSALVHQRPDILTAEARLHAAVAAIGMAQASLYPNITLGASIEQAASTTAQLFSSSFRGFDLFGGVSAPIFHGGTLRAGKRGAEAQAKAAAATYRETVLAAFAQVSDLLAGLSNDGAALASARQTSALAEQSLALSRLSFQVGNAGILQVLDASRANQRAKLALLNVQSRQYLTITRLYVATAGGIAQSHP